MSRKLPPLFHEPLLYRRASARCSLSTHTLASLRTHKLCSLFISRPAPCCSPGQACLTHRTAAAILGEHGVGPLLRAVQGAPPDDSEDAAPPVQESVMVAFARAADEGACRCHRGALHAAGLLDCLCWRLAALSTPLPLHPNTPAPAPPPRPRVPPAATRSIIDQELSRPLALRRRVGYLASADDVGGNQKLFIVPPACEEVGTVCRCPGEAGKRAVMALPASEQYHDRLYLLINHPSPLVTRRLIFAGNGPLTAAP